MKPPQMISLLLLISISIVFGNPKKCVPLKFGILSNHSLPHDLFRTLYQCQPDEQPFRPATIRILYEVSNLTRYGFSVQSDVYVRMAVFLKYVRQQPGWSSAKLVLPPFRNMSHWKNEPDTKPYFWNHFYDLPSLNAYTEVLDTWQFFDEPEEVRAPAKLEMVFMDIFHESEPRERYLLDRTEYFLDPPWTDVMGYSNLTLLPDGKNRTVRLRICKFHGSTVLLQQMLEDVWRINGSPRNYVVYLREMDKFLHDNYGSVDYWRARRSMRFAQRLLDIALEYRVKEMGVDTYFDHVPMPKLWQNEQVRKNVLLKSNIFINIY